MCAINFTVPYLINLILNDSLVPLELNKVSYVYQEMGIDCDGTSPAVQGLKTDTNDEVIEQVKSYVLGYTVFDTTLITEESLLSYLAAAKIVDLTIPASEQTNSTIIIRDACLAEPNTLKKLKQISLLNGYIIPKLTETRIEFLNRYEYSQERDIRQEMQKYAESSAYFHRDTFARFEAILKRSVNAIAESTKHLKDRSVFFNGPSGVGKTTHISKFVQNLAGEPVDLKNIVYGTDIVMGHLQEQFPTCQSTPSFILGVALRHVVETAIKTHAIGKIFFLQEGLITRDEVALTLLKDTKELEVRDFDAPFKSIVLRALNREILRKERPVDFVAFAKSADTVRKARITLLNNLSENQSYIMNYDGTDYSAEEMKFFHYHEPDLLAIGNTLITAEDVVPFNGRLDPYIGMTLRKAADEIDALIT
jgi:hypothetical protein